MSDEVVVKQKKCCGMGNNVGACMSLESPATPEAEPCALFKVTLARHEEPYYRDEGHDLTPDGFRNAEQTGKRLAQENHFAPDDEVHIFH